MTTSSTVQLTAADGFKFPAYVAAPAGTPKGAIVVVQEIFGVNSHIRSVADRYAAAGYLAVAPSIFDRAKTGVELGYTPEDMKEGVALKAACEALPPPGTLQDIQAAVSYAAKAGKVGIVGYCWGGLLAWRSAEQVTGLAAAVSYYGGGMTMGTEPSRVPKVPVMAHFGDKDAHITVDSVKAFEKAHPEVEVHLYAADHGFNCDQRGSYNAGSAATALERSLYHFGRISALHDEVLFLTSERAIDNVLVRTRFFADEGDFDGLGRPLDGCASMFGARPAAIFIGLGSTPRGHDDAVALACGALSIDADGTPRSRHVTGNCWSNWTKPKARLGEVLLNRVPSRGCLRAAVDRLR